MNTEEMYLVFDIEDQKYIDIRDLEKELCVIDSTTYFDKRHAQQFTTLGMRAKFTTFWQDFWNKKDRTKIKLINACQSGNIKVIKKLLNKLREAEKIGDIKYFDDKGLSALHIAAKFN